VKFTVFGARPPPGSALNVTVWGPPVAPDVTTRSDNGCGPALGVKLVTCGAPLKKLHENPGSTLLQERFTCWLMGLLGKVPLVVMLKLSLAEVPVPGAVIAVGDVVYVMLTTFSVTFCECVSPSASMPAP